MDILFFSKKHQICHTGCAHPGEVCSGMLLMCVVGTYSMSVIFILCLVPLGSEDVVLYICIFPDKVCIRTLLK